MVSVADKPSEDASRGRGGGAIDELFAGGVLVSFRGLSCTAPGRTKKEPPLTILEGVSGYLRPGELVYLMGPSGIGKSSLLDILAGRKTTGDVQGEILYSGVRPSPQFLRRFTGYVEQRDTMVGALTVYEFLIYSAELKLPISVPFAEKQAVVERTIEALGLSTCRDVIIGNDVERGISGGQRKRVNIALGLLGTPRVLFLDEPTTGLDSFTSNEVMLVVKDMARKGITVCATIHSPTPYSFSLCDRIMVLIDGRVAYFGRSGEQVVEYFQSHDPDIETLTHQNDLAEWIVDVTTEADRQGRGGELADAFEKSELRRHADEELEAQLARTAELPPETLAALAVKRECATPTWWQLRTLLAHRSAKNFRMAEFYGARVAPAFVQVLLIFSIFWGVARNITQSDLTSVSSLCFMWCVLPSFGAAAYTPQIMLERPLFVRERSDGLYSVAAFLGMKLLEESIVNVPVSAIMCVIVWYSTGLAGSFAINWLTFLTTWTVGICMSYAISAVSPNLDIANASVPAYGVINLFFAGFVITVSDMGWWWRWYSYLNFVRWGFGAQLSNQFGGGRDMAFVCPGGVPPTSPDCTTVLQFYGADWFSPWIYLLIEAFFIIFFVFAAWAALRFVQHQKR